MRTLNRLRWAKLVQDDCRLRAAPRRQKSRLVVFKHGAAQASGNIGARIDCDAIGMHLRPFDGRVPMHDDLPKIRVGLKKPFPDRQQIGHRLLLESNARTHTGMNEKVITNFN
jgi:hypothetical protein